ncbi:hypothetical protein Cali_246 [Mycobacterium phage Cali]|uniref:Uncharacterized protein n=18 Tax=Bixzunavirus TaxID=680114 RepID=B5LLJ4_9CAUD|nr:hypothetical protein SCOTTMCG_248 [Mycobacterium phage ScottMcG]YP_002224688.1 gp246 [Mycobacterium phage Cali]YP_009014811.1 hypothetical protein LINSTU_253 [Mycobacterium phage LinStu]YP_009204779.1 hypothetical protein HYRO_241 [Mycobacterium phage HyRo]YP_009216477.1 hypothetical protein ALICE_242 [Mycobacterium phage Alice]YP_009608905.1 hypothetical protein FDI20_gp094 [Mycobacterium phage Sebata]YP_010057398.1 hypothetical protein KHO59_gp082 [Mycobacterium phage Cane17]YP_01005762
MIADFYYRRVDQLRKEVVCLGKRLDAATTPEEVNLVATQVRDLRTRVRRMCDELDIFTDGSESLDCMVGRIMRTLSGKDTP